jgi:hypothetical protein
MKQFDAIVEGIKQNKVKVSTSENKTNSFWAWYPWTLWSSAELHQNVINEDNKERDGVPETPMFYIQSWQYMVPVIHFLARFQLRVAKISLLASP